MCPRGTFNSNSDRLKSSDFKKTNGNNRFSSDKSEQKTYKKTYNPNFKQNANEQNAYKKSYNPDFKQNENYTKSFVKKKNDYSEKESFSNNSEIRLNKFIANAGICSRRNADIYISSGNVEVNGEVMTTLGYRVKPTDIVKFDGKVISSEKKEYILLNKPKGFITTTNDEKGRKTVMDLVANATNARILPVGRLDRPNGNEEEREGN